MALRALSCAVPLLLAFALQGCSREEAAQSANAKVTDVVCYRVVTRAVRVIEESAVAMLEELCGDVRNHSDVRAALSREALAEIEDECLGRGADEIMANLREGRHEMNQRCNEYVLEKLEGLETNETALVVSLWHKTQEFANQWASENRSAWKDELKTTTLEDVTYVGASAQERAQNRAQELEQSSGSAGQEGGGSDASDGASGSEASEPKDDASLMIARRFSLPKRVRAGAGRSSAAFTISSALGGCSILLIAGAALVGARRMVRARSTSTAHVEESVPFVVDAGAGEGQDLEEFSL